MPLGDLAVVLEGLKAMFPNPWYQPIGRLVSLVMLMLHGRRTLRINLHISTQRILVYLIYLRTTRGVKHFVLLYLSTTL